jgi:1,4-alpha-glucan branching enzyme
VPAATVAFVLHAHLPDTRAATAEDSIEARWLFEALTDTYVPLAALLDGLAADGVPAGLSLSLSPTLLAQLTDGATLARYERHLERLVALADAEIVRTLGDRFLAPLAQATRARLVATRERFFDRYGGDLVAVFAEHAAGGRLDLLTTSATHAVLPLHLESPAWARAQIDVGVAEHRRHFGRSPDGFWLPECAYDPRLDEPLRRAGIRHVVVDTHGLTLASPQAVYGPWAPVATPAGLIVVARDPETARQVWSADGFPGDPWYREYHRDLGYDLAPSALAPFLRLPPGGGPTGFKYFRVTGGSGAKAPYEPARAAERVRAHAETFADECRLRAAELARVMDRPPLFVCPYDAELFGHWWHEGMAWLDAVLRRLAADDLLCARPLGTDLRLHPIVQQATPAPSSWGAGGHLDVWLSGETAWAYPRLAALAEQVALLHQATPPGPLPPALRSAIEHLMLAQASDWPFMISRRTAAPYGRTRLAGHLDACTRLCDALARGSTPPSGDLRPEALFPTLDGALADDLLLSRSAPIPYTS